MIEDTGMNDVEWKEKKLYDILFLSNRIWIIYYILIIYLSMAKKRESLILGLGISI